ncbi:MAG: hypothetical protein AAFY88_08040, partial [Acidobacteriota bacterium]
MSDSLKLAELQRRLGLVGTAADEVAARALAAVGVAAAAASRESVTLRPDHLESWLKRGLVGGAASICRWRAPAGDGGRDPRVHFDVATAAAAWIAGAPERGVRLEVEEADPQIPAPDLVDLWLGTDARVVSATLMAKTAAASERWIGLPVRLGLTPSAAAAGLREGLDGSPAVGRGVAKLSAASGSESPHLVLGVGSADEVWTALSRNGGVGVVLGAGGDAECSIHRALTGPGPAFGVIGLAASTVRAEGQVLWINAFLHGLLRELPIDLAVRGADQLVEAGSPRPFRPSKLWADPSLLRTTAFGDKVSPNVDWGPAQMPTSAVNPALHGAGGYEVSERLKIWAFRKLPGLVPPG